jgi:hypothetical protein
MPQYHLDRPDIDARFQEVRRKAMPQAMDAVAVRDAGGPLRVLIDCLGRAHGHGRVGIEARKPPLGWPVECPRGAQCGQAARREQRVAILAPFAWFDPEQSALTFTGRELQADDFTDAQARGRGRHQEDTVPGGLGAREQALEFRDAQDLGELR